ncbi:MAG: hypothetical protein AABY22_13190 [Nanoarchaeota archaeon]
MKDYKISYIDKNCFLSNVIIEAEDEKQALKLFKIIVGYWTIKTIVEI